MPMPRTEMAERSAELQRRRYTITCTDCDGLFIHTNGAAQAAQVVQAHEQTCTGTAVAHPHPIRDRRNR